MSGGELVVIGVYKLHKQNLVKCVYFTVFLEILVVCNLFILFEIPCE
jgi:hypothetical protein